MDFQLLKKGSQPISLEGFVSAWRELRGGVPQSPALSSLPFSIFIHDLDEGTEVRLTKLVDDTKLGGTASTSEDRLKVQKNLDRQGLIHPILFVGKCKVLHLMGKKANARSTR